MLQRLAARILYFLTTDRGSNAVEIQRLSVVTRMSVTAMSLRPHSRVSLENGSDLHSSAVACQVAIISHKNYSLTHIPYTIVSA